MSQASIWIPELQDEDYQALRKRAQNLLRFETACTLTATGLVHEMMIRLQGYWTRQRVDSEAVANPTPLASRVMKQILIDRARKRLSRGRCEEVACSKQVDLDGQGYRRDRLAYFLVELDDAIRLLSESLPELAQLARYRLYDELSVEESAKALGWSRAKAYRKWDFCRAWLATRVSRVPE